MSNLQRHPVAAFSYEAHLFIFQMQGKESNFDSSRSQAPIE